VGGGFGWAGGNDRGGGGSIVVLQLDGRAGRYGRWQTVVLAVIGLRHLRDSAQNVRVDDQRYLTIGSEATRLSCPPRRLPLFHVPDEA